MVLLCAVLKGFTQAINLHLLKSRSNVGLQKYLRSTRNAEKIY